MLDPRLIRAELENVETQLARRNFKLDTDAFRALEAQRRDIQ
ncbi:hypothetical protein, partial [Methylomagnum sp.]